MNSIKHKTAKKITSVLLSATTMVWLAGASAFVPMVASADAATDALIAQLQAQIAALTTQLAALSSSSSTTSSSSSSSAGCSFSRNLTLGSKGDDVVCLQNYLTAKGFFTYSGGSTGFFGEITRAAVSAWQAANGVSPTAGYFGAISRAKYASMVSSTSTTTTTTTTTTTPPTTTPPAGSGLSVTAGTQPANSLAPHSAARVPFTRIVLTASNDGDVSVNGIVVERTGLAQDAIFSGIVLLDEAGMQVGLEKTFNSDHKATIGDTFVIPKGTSKSFTVAGNMATDLTNYAGQVAYLTVNAVNSSAVVSGSLPITGAAQTINQSLTIGSITVATGPLDPLTASQSKKVGSTDVTFSSVKITAGSAENVVLRYIRWNQSGSVATSDLANVKTYVDGVPYDVVVSSDGKYFTTNLNNMILGKGNAVEMTVKGDVVGGSGRTADFDIYRRVDLAVDGQTYGYGILPPNGTDSSGTDDSAFHLSTNPWFDAGEVAITNGSITVSKATSVAAQNIATGLANQPLGGFDVEVKGEPITVSSMVFHIATTSAGVSNADYTDLTSVSLVGPSGNIVAGPVDAATQSGTLMKVTFTDSVTFPIGKGAYTLKGKLSTDFKSNDTIAVSVDPDGDITSVTGQTTGNSITPAPTTSITANTMTVKAVSMTISVSGNPPAQSVVAGAQGFVFANLLLDATASGEDVKFVNLSAKYTFSGTGSVVGDLSGCQLWDGATAVTSTKDPSGSSADDVSFTFSGTGYVVPKGTVKTLSLACNIAGSTSNNTLRTWGTPATAPTVTGQVSGTSITGTVSAGTGQQMTIVTGGALTVAKDSSSPSYGMAAGGSSNVTLGVLKFTGTNEALTLTKVALTLTGNAASSSPTDLSQVTLWDGATQVGTAVFVGRSATSTLSGSFVIPKDGSKILTVKGDMALIGTSQPGTEGAFIKVDYNGSTLADTQAVGASSGTTVNSSSSSNTAMDGLRMFRSYPTVAKLSVPTNTLANGSDKVLLRFSVSANSAGDIGIHKFTIKIATTTAYVTSFNVYGYTDSAFSTGVAGVNAGGKLMNTDVTCGGAGITYCAGGADVVIDNAGTATVLQIPAGSTRYFSVLGTITTSAAGASVQTQLEGDAAYPTMNTLMGSTTKVEADANDDFIWSGNATTSGDTSVVDFSNGYGVPGLPGTNLGGESLSQ